MAMVQQGVDGELTNQNEVEEDSHVSENSEAQSSRTSSRNSSRSKRSSPCLPQYQYSKDELMELSKLPLSQRKPDILNVAHYNVSGKWDPEEWFISKRGCCKPAQSEEPRPKRERQEVEVTVHHKRRTSDPRERIKEEKDEIILSPQRRSFGTGCHVIPQSSFLKRAGSPVDNRENESFRDSSRRIGSGRIMGRERDNREWEREHREYSFNGGRNDRRERFDQEDNEKDTRRYSNRYGRNDRKMRGHERIDEEEPEWFSSGPTSQSETIELVGFDEANDGDEKKSSRRRMRKNKEIAQRQPHKGDEGDKPDPHNVAKEKHDEKTTASEAKSKRDENKEVKAKSPDLPLPNGTEEQKSANMKFEFNDLLLMDWIPGLSKDTVPEASNGITGSRFSQWFQRESPTLEIQGSGNNSRRSSYNEELLAHVLSGMGEPQFLLPSPTQSGSENYFTPISPASRHSPLCHILPPHPAEEGSSKNLLEMLHQSSDKASEINSDKRNDPHQHTNIKEMEAGLKLLVLGNQNQPPEDGSALNKLLQHISGSAPSSISVGPFDKSKALQENDILQNMLTPRPQSPPHRLSPQRENAVQHGHFSVGPPNNMPQQLTPAELYSKLMPPQEHNRQQFEMQQVKQQQMMKQHNEQMMMQNQHHQQQQVKQSQGPQVFTVDMLAKMLDQQPLRPVSPVVQQPPQMLFNRNEQQSLNALLQQQQRQREMMNSLMKPQPVVQLPQPPQVSVGHPHQHKTTAKDLLLGTVPQQTLGLPGGIVTGPSPRQSPLPPDIHGSVIQGRIPSPLVFGQQPPVLSHAPAPIHPNHLQQNLSNSNTLQVQQNSMVLKRVPSPQELAAHTQTILQNALIKRKLEEQKENFRKRLEAQRTNSPNLNKSGNSVSPLKGLSPTIAFTPTSVMRKMHSEKADSPQQKSDTSQNGNKISGPVDGGTKPPTVSSVEAMFNNLNQMDPSLNANKNNMPRAVCGQYVINSPRSQLPMNMSNVMNMQTQGRPIVKGSSNAQPGQPMDPGRTPAASVKPNVTNKLFSSANNSQFMPMHSDRENTMDAMNKFIEQQRLMQQQKNMLGQRRQNSSPMPPVHSAAAAAFGFPPRNHAMNAPTANLVRPMQPLAAASNLNYPLLRNVMQANSTMRSNQPCTFNQLRTFGQFPAMQRVPENRQVPGGSRNYNPLAFQHLLLNTQHQVAANAQGVVGLPTGHGDGKHPHLMPGQSSNNRQSPANLTKWFGNDVLKQKMPEMPPVSHQKALRLEDIEQQQNSAAVHN